MTGRSRRQKIQGKGVDETRFYKKVKGEEPTGPDDRMSKSMKEFMGLKRRFDEEQRSGHKRKPVHREDIPESQRLEEQNAKKAKFSEQKEGESTREYGRRLDNEARQMMVADAKRNSRKSRKRKEFKEKKKAQVSEKLAEQQEEKEMEERYRRRQEEVDFGDVAMRPPTLKKPEVRLNKKQILAAAAPAKSADEDGDHDNEETARAEMDEKAKQRQMELMRQRVVTAYRDMKKKKRQRDDAQGVASAPMGYL
eukprot:TRINITY_DN8261_c0_g1_i1.p1 TRINITY_DN8261_c0_g1~~TRINITY_DN8261_c0_g1_i1.p1  ORF type:complete len:260 (+),score=69.25 TRINITY_DN8261_c0_g1_i1:25-780(+)